MKKLLLFLAVVVLSFFAIAHEFWLLPQKFFYTVRETAIIRFKVGEHFSGENWRGNRESIQQLLYYPPSGEVVDMASGLSSSSGDSVRIPLHEEGTHMLVFNSKNSFISLEAEKFNAYLQEDGLDQAMAYRKQQNEENKTGTEHYQRSVKTIFQVGSQLSDPVVSKATPLPLDIVPLENPYSIPDPFKNGPVKVSFRVFFKNRPLENALVKIWYQTKNRGVEMDSLRTNKKGIITTERRPGHFMVSCVHMEHTPADREAEWQSYWASLSFEYSQFFPRSSH